MASKALQRLSSIHNPMHKPPTYEELGRAKPRKEGRNDNTPLPIRFILCDKCKQPGGTMIRISKDVYRHQLCHIT